MGVIIKKIELNNWFGYFGPYEDNVFEFADGVNIVVAANDIGKSKLHNAFRWILYDELILKLGEKYELCKINNGNAKLVFNNERYNKIAFSESDTMGVRITVELIKPNGDKINRILTKEIPCTKDINILLGVIRKKVQRNEGGTIRSVSDDFDDLVKLVIRYNLRNFFLVQGEALEHLTPLKGEKLRTTINSLFSLEILDNHCSDSVKFAKQTTTLRSEIEKLENTTRGDLATFTQNKIDLESKIKIIEEEVKPEQRQFLGNHLDIINNYRAQAEIASANKDLGRQVDDFNSKIQLFEGIINQKYKSLVENCINKDFWISKIGDNETKYESIIEHKELIRDFSAKRRTELNDALSQKEQNMLYKLERDQPRPEILNEMMDEGTCYVCANSLSMESKKYIKEKLIPFFRNELNNNDVELDKYNELNELFKKFDSYLFKYKNSDSTYIQNLIDGIIQTEREKREHILEKVDFVNLHGLITASEDDLINLATYDKAITDYNNTEKILEDLDIESGGLKADLVIVLRTLEQSNIGIDESDKLKKSKNIEIFSSDFRDVLIEIKKDSYQKFVDDLERISNNKFRAYTEGNEKFNNQSIKINFSLNVNLDPEFEVSIVDTFGNSMSQGGGASQVLRQLSLIFGLIEKARGEVDYPFIADAPTSNMTQTLTKHFFTYQLENASNQNILITKDLWNDELRSLNSVGTEILELINSLSNARMICIEPKENKKTQVKITYK